MNIGLDYDGTFTAHPEMWIAFIENAHSLNHRVYIVTARMDSEENKQEIAEQTGLKPYRVYMTSGSAKSWYCEQIKGTKIDIWIDDNPSTITNGI